jgi:hypothetical protein
MIWCLDHAECSKEIALCIFESLCIKETPLHKKVYLNTNFSKKILEMVEKIRKDFGGSMIWSQTPNLILIAIDRSLQDALNGV